MIFLTSKDEEIDELFGLKMGADDFIRKPFSQRLLVERVKAVLRRATPEGRHRRRRKPTAKALERGLLRMDPERHTCTWKNEPVTLTVTEFLILQALATRPGVVKSRNALMDAAYDDQVYVDDRTIDSHIKRLRKKFKVGRRRFRDDRDALRRRLSLQGSMTHSLGVGGRPIGGLTAASRLAVMIAGARFGAPTVNAQPAGLNDVLDRTAEMLGAERRSRTAAARKRSPSPAQDASRVRGAVARSAGHFFVSQSFSSLTRRIVFLNLAGLVALVIGMLYLSQFRAGLIDARVQSLLVQGEIIAGAIAASATVETDSITIDPERLLELQAGESYGPADDALSGIEFPINPERVAPVLRRLISPTKTRARIYDRDGVLILDSRNLYGRGDVLRFDLPPPNAEKPGLMERAFIALRRWFGRGDLPLYKELGPENGKGYPEVAQALNGAARQHGAGQRPRRGDRLGRGAGAALPRRARRAACCRRRAPTSTRWWRPSGSPSSKCSWSPPASWWCSRCCSPAPSPARCAGSPTAPSACAGASAPASRFPISPAGATRSGICPARCAT